MFGLFGTIAGTRGVLLEAGHYVYKDGKHSMLLPG